MFRLTKPSTDETRRFLANQINLPFSYDYRLIGATRNELPDGYALAHYRARLGTGEQTFQRAKDAIGAWRMFPPEMVEIHPNPAPIDTGVSVALRINAFGLWTLGACRIVYTVNDSNECGGAVDRFGFAYGTLPQHVERGEERFLVEWNHRDNSVWYDLIAFSQPNDLFVWLSLPLARLVERRFGRRSCHCMIQAVNQGG